MSLISQTTRRTPTLGSVIASGIPEMTTDVLRGRGTCLGDKKGNRQPSSTGYRKKSGGAILALRAVGASRVYAIECRGGGGIYQIKSAGRKGRRPWVRSQVVGQMYRTCMKIGVLTHHANLNDGSEQRGGA